MIRDILLEKNLQPLRRFLDDKNIKEIIVTKPYCIALETLSGEWLYEESEDLSLIYFYGLGRILAVKDGKRFDESNPVLSALIDDKHRVNIVYGKQTNNDISLAIRLKRNQEPSLDQFEISPHHKKILIKLVQEKKNIIISGGTGTGKTTLLNALVKYMQKEERIITIENVQEIEIDPSFHKHHDALIYLQDDETQISNLLNASLRMRPDRIIIGELRKENSYVFLRAVNTGHEGSIATIHASSHKGAIDALIHNIKTSSKQSHETALLKKEIIQAVDAVIQLRREYRDGRMYSIGDVKMVKKL